MKALREVISTALVVSMGSVLLAAGCGSEAAGEGEPDPEEILAPSDSGKDASLRALGIDSEKRGASGNVTYLGGRVMLDSAGVDAVRAFIRDRLAGTYELAAGTDFTVLSDETDRSGRHRFVRMQQTVDGIAVAHGQVAVHLEGGAVVAILGELVPRARARVTASDGAALIRGALERFVAARDLIIHQGPSAAVYVDKKGESRTAFRAIVEYRYPEGRALDEVFVDQESGSLLGRYTQIHSALSRQIYDLRGGCVSTGSNLPGTSLFGEGGSSPDSAAMNAYNGSGTTYWFYKNFLGRDSYDARGARLVSTVHATFSTGASCSPNNAAWLGYPYNQMVYGDGDGRLFVNLTRALDVTGHELTHAVTDATSKLVYENESGALNEAMSDILGVATLAWQRGGGTQSTNPTQFLVDTRTWMVGADAAGPELGGALRYMNDPTKDGYSRDFYPERIPAGGEDNGGVHGNSGIANLAFYLLVQGGRHPRNKTTTAVTGIGMEKAVRIFYDANTSILTSTATFHAARNATAQAAQGLYGACSMEWANTHRAWDAVGVPGSWTPCSGPTPTPTPGTTIPEVKPNSTFKTAMAITQSGTTVIGQLAGQGDSGFFKVQLAPRASLTASLKVPATSDFDLYVYNSNGTLIGKSENGLGLVDEVKVTNSGTSTFTRYVRVTYYKGAAGSAAPYELKLVF